jgi:hypothetical protein
VSGICVGGGHRTTRSSGFEQQACRFGDQAIRFSSSPLERTQRAPERGLVGERAAGALAVEAWAVTRKVLEAALHCRRGAAGLTTKERVGHLERHGHQADAALREAAGARRAQAASFYGTSV